LKPETLGEPRLVGRAKELEQLQCSLDSAISGNGITVFISGEAGSGKTRLTREFLDLARNRRITVLTGWCLSNAAAPYFPFLEAFDSYMSSNEAEGKPLNGQLLSAKTWLIGPANLQMVTPQAWKDQTFASVTKELLYLSTIHPLILFIDDVHWADSASMSLLHYISRFVGTERVLVLATFRSEEISTEIGGPGHQLAETLRLMGREGLFKEIRLSGLSQAQVGEITESMLDGKPQEDLVEQLATESRGIPLFVVESVRMLSEENGLVCDNGQWRLSVDRFCIPAKVKDVILRRIESLKPSQRRVLEAASVIGEKFDPKLLAAVVSQDSLDVLESLNTIAERTLLVYCEANYYRFDHAKSQEMLYERIQPLLKEEYHSRIAEKMELLNQIFQRFPAGELAYHFTQTSNKEKSVKYALLAGKDALTRFSNTEAIKHFYYVVQTVGEDSTKKDQRNEALQGLGEAFFASSKFEEAGRAFEQIYSTQAGIAQLRAYRWAMDAAFFKGDTAKLTELTKEAEAFASLDRLEWARVRMNRGRANLLIGNRKEGLEDFIAALRVDEEEYSLPDTARTLIGLGVAYFANNQLENALLVELRGIALFEELEDLRGQMDAYNRAGQYGFVGLTQEAIRMYSKAIALGEKIADYNRAAEATASLSAVFEPTDLDEALSLSLKALEYAQKTDSNWTLGTIYSNLVRQYAKLEKISEAEAYFEKLSKLKPLGPKNRTVQRVLSSALLHAAKNQWEEATQYFNEVFEWIKNKELSPAAPAPIISCYVWALKRQGSMEEATMHEKKMQEYYQRIRERFEQINIQANLMAVNRAEIGQIIEARLDIVNLSRKCCTLVKVENLSFPTTKIAISPLELIVQNNTIDMKGKKLNPFQLITIKTSFKLEKPNASAIRLKVIYTDEFGNERTCETNLINIAVNSGALQGETRHTQVAPTAKPEFRSEASRKVYEYLIDAFMEDYTKRRMPKERSGWRTLMDVVRQSKVSKYSVYGSTVSRGQVICELERNGLIERRFFSAERGRGGEILKVRVLGQN
jgi:tetratricopeptide (TPR) repeat protein